MKYIPRYLSLERYKWLSGIWIVVDKQWTQNNKKITKRKIIIKRQDERYTLSREE